MKTLICRVCNKPFTEDRSMFVVKYVCKACLRQMDEGDEHSDDNDAMPLIVPTSILGAIEAIVDEGAIPTIEPPEPEIPESFIQSIAEAESGNTTTYDPSPEVSDPGTSFDY